MLRWSLNVFDLGLKSIPRGGVCMCVCEHVCVCIGNERLPNFERQIFIHLFSRYLFNVVP